MSEAPEIYLQVPETARIKTDITADPLALAMAVYQLWGRWADFELYVTSPSIAIISPPLVHEPELLPGSSDYEFVYPIHDYGYRLVTSKGSEMFSAGASMCKLFYTIEKMIYLLVERLKSGGVDETTEVQVAFGGFEIAQRKAFESIINLSYNVIVTNFDPGLWGEEYLQRVKRLAERGYGYPKESPRDIFRQPSSTISGMQKGG